MKRPMPTRLALCLLGSVAVIACDDRYVPDPPSDETLTFTPTRPDRDDAPSAPVYTGDDPIVREAQSRFPTGLDLHAKVIRRSCSPNDGVCHHTKEYPDLHTAANFLGAVNAPCNIQAGTREAIFDRCERPGDRFELASGAVASGPVEIGWIAHLPGDKPAYSKESPPGPDSPGLHIVLADPVRTDRQEIWSGGRFIRTFIEGGLVRDIAYQTFSTRWWILEGGLHLVGEVDTWQLDEVTRLLDVGVVEGDPNKNGVFGARVGDPIALMVPGAPDLSYLVGRLRGRLDGADVPGTRMPLANQPLSASEMLALYCFIEGVDDTPTRLDGAIDYANCTWARDPSNLDTDTPNSALTWSGRIARLLEVNCGGCHDAETPTSGLPLAGPGVYERLIAPTSDDALPLVTPFDPDASYLYLKLVNDPRIEGGPMPTSPISGWRPLPGSELEAIRAWIAAGALP